MLNIPIPFDENDIETPDWSSELWDKNLPSLGFIRDFVYYGRRIETPTKFACWTAVFVISSVLKRDTYLEWFPRRMYPNFFVFLVGPPRVCGKGTIMEVGEKLLDDYHSHFEDPELRELKRTNLLRSRATPEALSLVLAPEESYAYIDKKVYRVDRGSQLALIIPELSTFLGKQKYNEGKIDLLTHLYDCKDKDDELTIGRKKTEFKNVYVTLLGGTTKDHLENSLPEQTFGGGFMSRVVIAYESKPTRCYPQTGKPKGSPDLDDLSYRLAWIAENARGGYTFSEEAQKAHIKWYYSFRDYLVKELNEKKMHTLHRMDVHLRKLSVIIRAQRYERGREITLKDYEEARRLLDSTLRSAHQSIEDVGETKDKKWFNRLVSLVKEKPRSWNELLRSLSPYGCYAQGVYTMVGQLMEEGRLECYVGSDKKEVPARKTNATYKWKR